MRTVEFWCETCDTSSFDRASESHCPHCRCVECDEDYQRDLREGR